MGVVEPQGFAGTPQVTDSPGTCTRLSFSLEQNQQFAIETKQNKKTHSCKGMSPWMKMQGKYLPLRRGDAALPHLWNSLSVAITTETAAFPVSNIIERQHGEESGPSISVQRHSELCLSGRERIWTWIQVLGLD